MLSVHPASCVALSYFFPRGAHTFTGAFLCCEGGVVGCPMLALPINLGCPVLARFWLGRGKIRDSILCRPRGTRLFSHAHPRLKPWAIIFRARGAGEVV